MSSDITENIVAFRPKGDRQKCSDDGASVAIPKAEYSNLVAVLHAATDLCNALAEERDDVSVLVSDLVRAVYRGNTGDELVVGECTQ